MPSLAPAPAEVCTWMPPLLRAEGNQFCRLVREVLSELDLPYELRSTGKGSPRREELAAVRGDGSTTAPFLLDPNTDTAMGESADICAYLQRTYGGALDESP